jgi:hypothetical protein
MPLSESQKGRVIEQIVGATLLLQSDGELRVLQPLVDDEGVDLVIGNRANDKTLLLQIKSRFSLNGRGQYRADVRRATFSPNPNKHVLFIYYDKATGALGDTCWLVCSVPFCKHLKNQRVTRPNYVFVTKFKASADMWVPYRMPIKNLADAILEVLS